MKSSDQKPIPPRWATRLLQWYCAPHLLEEVQGDLQEEFEFQIKQIGTTRARLDYIRNILGFIRPFAVKRKKKKTCTHRESAAARESGRPQGKPVVPIKMERAKRPPTPLSVGRTHGSDPDSDRSAQDV